MDVRKIIEVLEAELKGKPTERFYCGEWVPANFQKNGVWPNMKYRVGRKEE